MMTHQHLQPLQHDARPDLAHLARTLRTTPPGERPALRDAHEQRRLLERAASGDLEAFMDFYDATCDVAYRLELSRSRDPETALEATCARYLRAWCQVEDQPGSGLSPTAWLLSLWVGVAA